MTLLWPVLLALTQPAIATHPPNLHPNSVKACTVLSATHPHLVSLPSTPSYATHLTTYWSARQSEVHPACFLTPLSTADVAHSIALLTSLSAPFAIKGGGHTAFAGGSNAPGGVTLDLAGLNSISVAGDRRTVSVGAGNRWIDVTTALDPLGLAVVGGRSATVGVSGLTLGGGISYFSGRYGWACDNVRRYEVVLAGGEVVVAEAEGEYEELYWALRGGGGSNFGVVTRFDLVAVEQGLLWASEMVYPGVVNATVVRVMHGLLTEGLAADPAAHTFFVLTYAEQLGGYVVLSSQFHSTYGDGTAVPAVFAPLHDPALPVLTNNTRLANVSQLLRDIEEPFGARHTWRDTTVAATATPDLLLDLVPLWEEMVSRPLLAAAAADNSTMSPYLIYQAISTNIMEAMQVNGGNALGLRPEDGPIMIVQLAVTWTSAALDDLVESSCASFIAKVDALAASRNAKSKHGYIYMNYAGETQDVYASYGEENRARLKRVAKKYDPQGKLRGLWRGYFKV